MIKDKKTILKFIRTPLIIILLVGLCVSCILIYSANYNVIENAPSVQKGVIDFTEKGFQASGVCGVFGEWEFYYKDWLITDNVKREPDCFVKINDSWEGKIVDGKKISRSGYGSYRMIIKGMSLDRFGMFGHDKPMVSYRVFVNGKLHLQCGYPSKVKADDVLTDEYEKSNYVFSGDKIEDIEVVVEIGANDVGGISPGFHIGYTPNLEYKWDWEEPGKFRNHDRQGIFAIITIFTIGLLGTAILISLNYKKWYLHSIFYALTFLYLLFSRESEGLLVHLWHLPFYNTNVQARLGFVLGIAIFVMWIITLWKEGCIPLKKWEKILMPIFIAVVALVYIFAFGTRFRLSYLIIVDLLLIYWLFDISYYASKDNKLGNLYSSVMFGFFLTFNACEIDVMGYFGFTMEGITIVTMLVYASMYCLIFLFIIKKTYKLEMSYVEREQELEEVRRVYNKSQMNQDFVNAMLDEIVKGYKINTHEGDEILTKFSRQLRRNIDAEHCTMVKFQEALVNAQEYFDLENARYGQKMKLNYDVEEVDFDIPVLCLEQFVSHAISLIVKQDFYDDKIIITSRLVENAQRVTISCGVQNLARDEVMNNKSLGNAKQRIKDLLGTEVKMYIENSNLYICIEISK